MGLYVEPFRKAVAILTASVAANAEKRKEPYTMTDIVWFGIERVAKEYGVLTEAGDVAPEFRDQLDLMVEMVQQADVNG